MERVKCVSRSRILGRPCDDPETRPIGRTKDKRCRAPSRTPGRTEGGEGGGVNKQIRKFSGRTASWGIKLPNYGITAELRAGRLRGDGKQNVIATRSSGGLLCICICRVNSLRPGGAGWNGWWHWRADDEQHPTPYALWVQLHISGAATRHAFQSAAIHLQQTRHSTRRGGAGESLEDPISEHTWLPNRSADL